MFILRSMYRHLVCFHDWLEQNKTTRKCGEKQYQKKKLRVHAPMYKTEKSRNISDKNVRYAAILFKVEAKIFC